MKQAIIYARVSTKEQQKEGFSIPSQVKLLTDYADKKGISIVKEFSESETAKKIGRKEFTNLIEFLKTNKQVRIVLVEKTDRLTRNFNDYVLIDQLINELDIEVHLVKEGEVLSKQSKSHSKLIHSIKVAIAKNFIDNLSEETSKGMIEKAAQGHYPSKAPYGYKNVTQTKSIVINETQAYFVKRVFELYSTGYYSLKTLADELFEQGLIFRPSQPKVRTTELHRILTNKFYTGYFTFKDISRIGHHPPIVSFDLFKTVQSQLKRHNKPRYSTHKFPYSNLIVCYHTGKSLTADQKKGKYTYYKAPGSPEKHIREELIEEQLTETVKEIMVPDFLYKWISDGLKQLNDMRDVQVSEDINHLTNEIKRTNSKLSALYDDKLEGLIDEAFYKHKARELRDRQYELEAKLSNLTRVSYENVEMAMQILDFAKDAHKYFTSIEKFEQAKFIKTISSNCYLKDGQVHLELKKPFQLLVNYAKKKNGTPNEIRTRVASVKGKCPRPLDDGGKSVKARPSGTS